MILATICYTKQTHQIQLAIKIQQKIVEQPVNENKNNKQVASLTFSIVKMLAYSLNHLLFCKTAFFVLIYISILLSIIVIRFCTLLASDFGRN